MTKQNPNTAITRRDLQVWLEDVWEADRRTVLLVTHDVDEAIRWALQPKVG